MLMKICDASPASMSRVATGALMVLACTITLADAQTASGRPTAESTATAPTTWTPEVMLTVRPIQAVAVSPDGRRAAFTTSEVVMTADKSEFVTQIHLSSGEGQSRQITFADKNSSAPQWSPDGMRLAFLSARSGKNQVYVLPLDGGEGEPITEGKADVAAFRWAPDGKSIAFTMADVRSEEEEKKTKGKDDARFFEENILYGRLYVVNLMRDAAGKREPKKLTTANRHVTTFDFSPDGRSLVYAHTRSPKANDWTTSDVSIVEIESGNIRTLAATAAAESQPLFSRDGRTVAMTVSSIPVTWTSHDRIAIVPATGGSPTLLPESFDMRPQLLGWSADGKSVLYSEARETLSAVYAQAVSGGAASVAINAAGLTDSHSLNATGTHLGFTLQANNKASEAHVATLGGGAPRQVSRVNGDLPALPLGNSTVVKWKSDDGLEVEGILTTPVGYTAGRRVPLLLIVHGGPSGVFSQRFIAGRGIYPIAAFSAKGFAVLQPNPRGSTGYGLKFRQANTKDWGFGDYRDLMRGVDKVIEMGIADSDRLGVMGWSYGGFMSSWIITQTNRFKAASIGAAVTNLTSFNGTTDIPDFVPSYFGGQSWEDPATYAKFGAMNQIGKARTPSLIQHNEGDIRVPISQGYELFNALKQQGVEARMLVVPRQTHGVTEPKAMLRVMQTNLDWFVEKLKP
jgi:dipeptidyl aminopeptidase/acylaminoacyl peptidase